MKNWILAFVILIIMLFVFIGTVWAVEHHPKIIMGLISVVTLCWSLFLIKKGLDKWMKEK